MTALSFEEFLARVDLRQAQQEVFGRDELVLHRVGLALGGVEHRSQVGTEGLLAAGHPGQGVQALVGGLLDLRGIDADAFQEGPDDLLLGIEEGRQQVERLDLLVSSLAARTVRPGRLPDS